MAVVGWNGLLPGTDKDDDLDPVVQSLKINLLNVLEINKQEYPGQMHLAEPRHGKIMGL